MRLSVYRTAMLAILLLVRAASARAQATGSIEGFVRDSAGHALSAVEVHLFDDDVRPHLAISDSVGRFAFARARAGEFRVRVRRLGYNQLSLMIRIISGQVTRPDYVLTPAPVILTDQLIEAPSDPTRGKMGPFNQRMSRGVGSFFTRAEIEKRQPASISELLRTVPGVNISQRMAGEPQPVHMQRSVNSSMQSTCVVQLYVDGQPYPNGNLDDFAPLTLEGVEVYRSASEIPAGFRTRDATCGLIALWTRDPEAARRKP